MTKVVPLVLVLLACGGLASCDIIGIACTNELGYEVQPTSRQIRVGESFQIEARAFSCGGRKDVPIDVAWTSTDTLVMRVTESGRVTGLRPGGAFVDGEDGSRYNVGPFRVPVEVIP